MHEVLGGSPVARITETDGQQTGCIAIVQLTPGRIFPLSAPLGQYLFLHFHICVHSYKWYKDQKTARDQKKILIRMQYYPPEYVY